ncbi:hypothetical protein ASPZODRAFT_17040 [Penicilliopsis zonata CBS 506.65]|uniref:N-acetyltransferase domain-containing protein n=1 Tax=Penicilliopsis zonata CBS 506.65 TaxID=1073090 RepID=A0A1L9SEL1_9EURO|nr:hypothetical protein ASPZODRAFT_17040 [Penicilliopsis zonata CBS 506.65]OJJ45588.1 hypothetical protein ASPZODRAFT_17040 [Penicilliopsis zonata CBS 506.65]
MALLKDHPPEKARVSKPGSLEEWWAVQCPWAPSSSPRKRISKAEKEDVTEDKYRRLTPPPVDETPRLEVRDSDKGISSPEAKPVTSQSESGSVISLSNTSELQLGGRRQSQPESQDLSGSSQTVVGTPRALISQAENSANPPNSVGRSNRSNQENESPSQPQESVKTDLPSVGANKSAFPRKIKPKDIVIARYPLNVILSQVRQPDPGRGNGLPGSMESNDGSDVILLRRRARGMNTHPVPDVFSGNSFQPKGSDDWKTKQSESSNVERKGLGYIKRDPYEPAPKEALEELEMLRQQVLQEANMNNFQNQELPTTDLQALARVRDGPGTDPKSTVYHQIVTYRRLPEIEREDSAAGSSSGDSKEIGNSYPDDDFGFVKENWTLYSTNARAYPEIKDGKLYLSENKGPGFDDSPQPTAVTLMFNCENLMRETQKIQESNEADVSAETRWTHGYYANWEYRPHACSAFEAFRDRFLIWLDGTLGRCNVADIYHKAFFDGTAHPDGARSFFIPNFPRSSAMFHPSDEVSALHLHETSLGFGFNFSKQEEERLREERAKQQQSREMYLQAARDAPVAEIKVAAPRANIYLRPVEADDIPDLVDLFNLFAQESFLSVDIPGLGDADIRKRMDDCEKQKLPFIVAVERQTGPPQSFIPTTERVVGYAFANDFTGERSAGRFTVELRLFVNPHSQRKGIGRCLLDKLLEVCDPMYNPRKGYFFDSSVEDRTSYVPGGRRKLARLVFAIGYPNDDRSYHQWVREWLTREYGFKEQGVLKGVRVKFKQFLNVSYLVREVSHNFDNPAYL